LFRQDSGSLIDMLKIVMDVYFVWSH